MSETIATTNRTPISESLSGSRTARPLWPDIDWDRADWTVAEYLALPEEVHAELVEVRLEPLSIPTWEHQVLVLWFARLLQDFALSRRAGQVAIAPLPVWLGPQHYREPDVVLVTDQHWVAGDAYPRGAALVMEVVSDSPRDRQRDLVTKVSEYASAGIPEYWIVDPLERTIAVLTLPAGTTSYITHGVFVAGQLATSCLLEGFTVDVQACWDAAQGQVG